MRSNAAVAALTEELTADEQGALDSAAPVVEEDLEQQQEPVAAPEAEQPADPAAPPATADQRVPLSEHMEEKNRRRAAEQQLAEEKRLRDVERQRTTQILERLSQQPQPQQPAQPTQTAPAIPDFNQDPVGHMAARQQRTEAILGQVLQAVVGQNQQNQVADSRATLHRNASVLEREFAARTPDYTDAYQHVISQRTAMLKAAGWSDPAEISTMLASEAEGLAARALQLGKNPGEMVYEMAAALGYKPASAEPAPQPAISGEQQVAQIQRGQQTTRSVGNLRGGTAPPPRSTINNIIGMKDSDFSAWLDKATPEQLREVFGD